ncbi:translation initiation factor IF-3 [Candidatus Cytomitobacter indipagum]|uniref:Translation initiation factor IF-3 n=1 Tax=Candidatus Cytomitobacter indipagum TaxID=2601575 RepID=A0A5C0UD56_9PROT|nr:translation initiation factor IF-3 [Candidatus Cytomitobacter indipagum]QEK37908.1 translation initiation factor IF-3 [Candidatus Cytomitobacter indipagum]
MNKNIKKKVLMNNKINADRVSVIHEKEQMGTMSLMSALNMAEDMRLDLVQVSDGNVPTCRLMDYKQFLYKQNKKNAEIKRKSKTFEIKEIQIRPKIGQHDIETKVKHARRFLDAGNKVKVVLRLRGREMAHVELNVENVLKQFATYVDDISVIEKEPKQEMRNRIFMTLKPDQAKIDKKLKDQTEIDKGQTDSDKE